MTDLPAIADRHARAVSGLGDTLRPLRVAVLAGDDFAPAAQHLAVCLVNLLCRLVGSVAAIELDLPSRALSVMTPGPSSPGDATAQLIALAGWAVGGEVSVSPPSGEPHDLTICIGTPPSSFTGRIDIVVVGAGWRAWVGVPSNRPPADVMQRADANPLGPYLAAAFAAGEVFKRSRGLLRGRYAEDFGYSLWAGEMGAWRTLADGPPIAGTELPPFYLVGAGAVGQGLHAVLAAANLGAAFMITIDDDHHDDTNLNRCFVAGVDDVDRPKVDAITRIRKAAGLDGFEFKGTVAQYLAREKDHALRADVADLEANDCFRLVVSAVDKNSSRQDIQGLSPSLALGASTIGLTAKANVYEMTAGTACLACHNPPEDDGRRLREVEQRVRGMSEAQLRDFLAGNVADVEAVVAYLRNAQRCGDLGEADFRNFATRRTPEFSVSFVSMAAAVLLAARLLMSTGSVGDRPQRLAMSTLAFRNLDAGDDALAQDSSCPHCSRARRFAASVAGS